jgi:hypothetical protein
MENQRRPAVGGDVGEVCDDVGVLVVAKVGRSRGQRWPFPDEVLMKMEHGRRGARTGCADH